MLSLLVQWALDNNCSTLMKVRTQQTEVTCLKPYLEHFASTHLRAYFTNNDMVTPMLPMYINKNIITMWEMINETNFPTIAGGFLNNAIIKHRIPKQVFKGIEIFRASGINLVNIYFGFSGFYPLYLCWAEVCPPWRQ